MNRQAKDSSKGHVKQKSSLQQECASLQASKRNALKSLGLSVGDLELLCRDDEWLTDIHINASNKLLAQQFPTLNGFQDPVYLAQLDKPYKSMSSNFIQVININNMHWVCASNVLSSPGVVEVYDSKPICSINSSALHSQVAKILKTSEKYFQLNHVDVQRQIGSSDCALYAIANALTLCLGEDPHITSYNQGNFRAHLVKCFELQQITKFPIADRPRRLGRRRIISRKRIDVFCTCRSPWNRNDKCDKGPLVQCQLCKEWYHEACMDISKDVIDYPGLKYNCKLCLNV